MTEAIELTAKDLVPFNGEPRVLDVRLGEVLGFERPRVVRELIKRHLASLERFGAIISTVENNSGNLPHGGANSPHGTAKSDSLGVSGRGRPATAYLLNQKQALYICTKSETDAATEITIRIVEVFDAWMRGELVAPPVRRLTAKLRPDEINAWVAAARTAERIYGREAADALWRRSPLPKVYDRAVGGLAGTEGDDGIGALKHLFRYGCGKGITVRDLYNAAAHDDIARGRLLRLGIRLAPQTAPAHAAISNDHPFLVEVFSETQWAEAWHVALALLDQARPAKNPVTFDKARRATLVPLSLLDAIA